MIAKNPIASFERRREGGSRAAGPSGPAGGAGIATPNGRSRRGERAGPQIPDPAPSRRAVSFGGGSADGGTIGEIGLPEGFPAARHRSGEPAARAPLAPPVGANWRRDRSRRAEESSEARLIRGRLEELLSLALVHRRWTTRQLAAALDRCSGNVIPDSGLPKVDLLIRLADILGWPLETILAHLSEDLVGPRHGGPAPMEEHEVGPSRRDAVELLQGAHAALAAGDPRGALDRARAAGRSASRPDQRALASALEGAAWSRLGHWDRSIAPLQNAISTFDWPAASPRDPLQPMRVELATSLARAYHRSGLWVEGGAMAAIALELPGQGDARSLAARAEALSLRALCLRDGLEATGSSACMNVDQALDEARECLAILRWPAVADRFEQAPCIRLMTEAAILELRVHRGEESAPAAVACVLEGLEPWIDVDAVTERAGLAGAGWWSVLGFAIALRHLGGASRQQSLAILSNKADEIATAVGCSALRERVLRMEFERREVAASHAGSRGEWLLDEDDLRAVVECIGTSRRFRAMGMEMLRQATLVLSEPAQRQ